MKRFYHALISLSYLVVLLHSAIPHCDGACEEYETSHCEKIPEAKEAELIHILATFFSNAPHQEHNQELACHLTSSTYKQEQVKDIPNDKSNVSEKLFSPYSSTGLNDLRECVLPTFEQACVIPISGRAPPFCI